MYIKILTVVSLVTLLSGCVTTKKDMQIEQLQNRAYNIEMQLYKADKRLDSLEDRLGYMQETIVNLSKQDIAKEDKSVSQLSVRQIQIGLKNAGFYEGPVDGKMGPKTKDAVKYFQKANNLKADGIVGDSTSLKIRKYLTR